MGKGADEGIGVRALCGITNLLVRHVRIGIGDVLAHGAAEQQRFLEDHAHLARNCVTPRVEVSCPPTRI